LCCYSLAFPAGTFTPIEAIIPQYTPLAGATTLSALSPFVGNDGSQTSTVYFSADVVFTYTMTEQPNNR
jgi:hypothetical protein